MDAEGAQVLTAGVDGSGVDGGHGGSSPTGSGVAPVAPDLQCSGFLGRSARVPGNLDQWAGMPWASAGLNGYARRHAEESSVPPRPPARPPPVRPPTLDEVDLDLLRLLQTDGRRSVAALARDVGLAESTCAGRVRALTERGIVRGFVADIDAASVGFAVEAMVAIRFSGHVRTRSRAFRDEVAKVPGVLALYNTSGGNDFLVHVAATGWPDALRNSSWTTWPIGQVSSNAETSLIFEATRGAGLLPAGRQP